MKQKTMYGYCRVSTVKQGEGTSLSEQKDSIERYAQKHDFKIVAWFEEKETAAKQGRPVFTEMLSLLKHKKADGVIIHKIDRSARNLRDWAALGDLIDLGIDIHFSHEAVDFSSRGGRLAADITAVFSADYIRNLKEETKKGQRGRLKQGIYPWGAPIGYLNTGRGNLKEIDPERGHLITEMFKTYATGLYTLNQLSDLMYDKGLRNNQGGKVTKRRISEIFKNPFYVGILQIRKQGEMFQGKHPRLVSTDIYNEVQKVLTGKRHKSFTRHDFLYRRCIQCGLCGSSLTAETQKGHTYYRCRTVDCPTKAVREELINMSVDQFIDSSKIVDELASELVSHCKNRANFDTKNSTSEINGFKAQAASIRCKLESLTEKFAEDLVDPRTYQRVREKFLFQLSECKEKIQRLEESRPPTTDEIKQILKMMNTAEFWERCESHQEKRHLLKSLFSKLSYSDGKIALEVNEPYNLLSRFAVLPICCQFKPNTRIDRLIISFTVASTRGVLKVTPLNKKKRLSKDKIVTLLQRHDVMEKFRLLAA